MLLIQNASTSKNAMYSPFITALLFQIISIMAYCFPPDSFNLERPQAYQKTPECAPDSLILVPYGNPTLSPWVLTSDQGSLLATAIVSVWVAAWAIRQVISYLRTEPETSSD